jgi:hypothetical protein
MSTRIVIDADEWTALLSERNQLREVNCQLRDKLLELAKECSSCGGTGVVTVRYEYNEISRDRVEPCGDCLDIREALDP